MEYPWLLSSLLPDPQDSPQEQLIAKELVRLLSDRGITPDNLELISASGRQALPDELRNAFFNRSALSLPALRAITEQIRRHYADAAADAKITVSLNPLLMADIAMQQPAGTTMRSMNEYLTQNFIGAEVDPQDEGKLQGLYPPAIELLEDTISPDAQQMLEISLQIFFGTANQATEQHPIYPYEASKISMLYAQMHAIAAKYAQDSSSPTIITFIFGDDNKKILWGVREFFSRHAELLPDNVNLRFIHRSTNTAPVTPMKLFPTPDAKAIFGTGNIDDNYATTIYNIWQRYFDKEIGLVILPQDEPDILAAAFIAARSAQAGPATPPWKSLPPSQPLIIGYTALLQHHQVTLKPTDTAAAALVMRR